MKDATYTARIARHYAENVLEPDSGPGFAYADDRCLALPAGQTTEYTIEDVLRSLTEPQRDFARYLYDFAISLGCRSAVRVTSREHNGWKATCTLAESRRILATFHVEENAWDVKVNLPNLGDYLQQVFEDNRASECSTMVLQVLVRSPDCRPGCAVNCAMRPEFSWEGKAYKKCARLGFYFENPNMEILPCLTELMRQEAVR